MTEEKPLYPTKEEAYLAPGEIYQHARPEALGAETGSRNSRAREYA